MIKMVYHRAGLKLLGAMLFMALFFSACSNGEEPEQTSIKDASGQGEFITLSKAQFERGNYKIIKAQKQQIRESLHLTGVLKASPGNVHSISSFYGGRVSNLNLKEGDNLKAGQLLFFLEGPEIVEQQRDFIESTAQEEVLRSNYLRQKALWEDSVVSEKVYLDAKSKFETTSAKLQSLEAKLGLMGLSGAQLKKSGIQARIPFRAPLSGQVSGLSINNGYFLSPNEQALDIHDLQEPLIELKVFEKDLGRIKKGQQLDFYGQGQDGAKRKAEVFQVSQVLIPGKTYTIALARINDSLGYENLNYGVYLDAEIALDERSSFTLGEAAISEVANRYYGLSYVRKDDSAYYFQAIELDLAGRQGDQRELKLTQSQIKDLSFLDHGVFQLIKE